MKLEHRVTGDLGTRHLFQGAEGGSIPTVTLIGSRDARLMVERWHYTGRMPAGKSICFGWWVGGELYAVAVYGIGANPYQGRFIRKCTGWEFSDTELIELMRCVRSEPPVSGLQLSRFLSLCHRYLRQNGYRVVVAFSDPEAGHSGALYRAGNWRFLGQTEAQWHLVDREGKRRHRRYAFRYARRNGITIAEAREVLGCRRVKTAPKHRFALWIG